MNESSVDFSNSSTGSLTSCPLESPAVVRVSRESLGSRLPFRYSKEGGVFLGGTRKKNEIWHSKVHALHVPRMYVCSAVQQQSDLINRPVTYGHRCIVCTRASTGRGCSAAFSGTAYLSRLLFWLSVSVVLSFALQSGMFRRCFVVTPGGNPCFELTLE